MAKISLGRGFESLYGNDDSGGAIPSSKIAVAEIKPNPFQPRKTFSPESLEELAESIGRHGLLHPVIVVKRNDQFTLVSGERRLRAAEKLGWKEIEAVIREFTDQELLEIALVENLKRSDLNPLEIAEGLDQLSREFEWTQETISDHLGIKRSSVANYLRILDLEAEVKEFLREGSLTFGHAKILSGLAEGDQKKWARLIIAKGLSVRALEERLAKKPGAPKTKDNSVEEWIGENSQVLSSALHCRAQIRKQKKGWKVELSFNRMDELEEMITKLSERTGLQEEGSHDEA
ncbi:MAG: ParB/RepB/Spo0J family partition protein [Leptospirales bacterium]